MRPPAANNRPVTVTTDLSRGEVVLLATRLKGGLLSVDVAQVEADGRVILRARAQPLTFVSGVRGRREAKPGQPTEAVLLRLGHVPLGESSGLSLPPLR
ncbi:hypothetical protein [Deinococcus radiotolerans]|uniref:Uncharacterized protein n=1 Tax=Deinococcus radiotolerans TaxID=1309407 RepID=A0ABQ2FRR2_9DEIO|nr:hypothetical protein [Deinococcus radiotolerans]GGL20046.1 hypothetical protein GCM10010844_43700 [Deinococcus radiotolerans]